PATSHVPQVPSLHESSTSIPASASASRIDLSGGTITVFSEYSQTTSMGRSPEREPTGSTGEKRSMCRLSGKRAEQDFSTASSNPLGPQQYTSVSSLAWEISPSTSSRPCTSCGRICTRSPNSASSF